MVKQTVRLADLNIQFSFHYAGTRFYFKKFLDGTADGPESPDFCVPSVDLLALREETLRLNGNSPFAEFSLLVEPLANLLLGHGRFLFHGAAIQWHGKVFIFTAASGVGKSTQLRHWMHLFPDEISLINGDKPVIELRDTEFYVHPSPWQGKENWGGDHTALLGGIILLERGTENWIRRIPPKEAAYPVFLQFLYLPKDAWSVDKVCRFEEKMITKVPVWKLTNTGTPASARLTHDHLISEGV